MNVEPQDCKVILIVGLPGSGKTTLGKVLLNEDKEHSILLDDLSRDLSQANNFDPDKHTCVIITDPFFCGVSEDKIRPKVKDILNRATHNLLFSFEFLYFENDLEACLKNAARDPKPGGTDNFSKSLTKKYIIPDNAITIPVYKEPFYE